jgi:hypothetical protein
MKCAGFSCSAALCGGFLEVILRDRFMGEFWMGSEKNRRGKTAAVM